LQHTEKTKQQVLAFKTTPARNLKTFPQLESQYAVKKVWLFGHLGESTPAALA